MLEMETETPTTDVYMDVIMARATCEKHNAVAHVPCFILGSEGTIYYGVCNDRAVAAGFTGEISQVARGKNLKPSRRTSNNI